MAQITLFEQGDVRIIEIIGRLDGNSAPESPACSTRF